MNCLDCRAKCCGIYHVEIQASEIELLCGLLGMPAEEFKNRCTHVMPCSNKLCKKTHYYLNTKAIGKEEYCIFVDDATFKCMVYDVRPSVCSTYKCARYVERVARETGTQLAGVTSMISRLSL
jgi:Fe-S-cluster containining protein